MAVTSGITVGTAIRKAEALSGRVVGVFGDDRYRSISVWELTVVMVSPEI